MQSGIPLSAVPLVASGVAFCGKVNGRLSGETDARDGAKAGKYSKSSRKNFSILREDFSFFCLFLLFLIVHITSEEVI